MPIRGSDSALATFALFNEKATRLERSRFWSFLANQSLGWSFKEIGGEWHIEVRAPDEEATDAFLLTLRLFVQKSEAISIPRIAGLYENLALPEDLRERVRWVRTRLNAYLDSRSPLVAGERRFSRRWIFEAVLWGDRAHLNPEKRSEIEVWLRDPSLRAILESEFFEVVEVVALWIFQLRNANLEALALLGAASVKPNNELEPTSAPKASS